MSQAVDLILGFWPDPRLRVNQWWYDLFLSIAAAKECVPVPVAIIFDPVQGPDQAFLPLRTNMILWVSWAEVRQPCLAPSMPVCR